MSKIKQKLCKHYWHRNITAPIFSKDKEYIVRECRKCQKIKMFEK